MDRLTELHVLITIAETGSLAGAARRLRRSPPSVTRILADLEERLGVRLIERSSRRCAPTEAGRQLVEQARHLIGSYEDATSEASGEATAPRGSIKLTAPLVFGREHVAPLLLTFLDAQPAINVELLLSDRVNDLQEENIDLGVRIGRIADTSLIARRIGTVRRVVVASPNYLKAHGEPAAPADVSGHHIVQHSDLGPGTPWEFGGERARNIPVTPRLTVNQADVAVAAALAGRGLVKALSYQVARHVAEGRLVRVLRDFETGPMPVHIVWPESRRPLQRVRLLIDHLVAGLQPLDVLQEVS
ncbi:MAG: LysR family transcriptional regulator [Sphingosinicella sp.]|nr:LysR family transcriptional regulator [Sphingosinicella sp.]